MKNLIALIFVIFLVTQYTGDKEITYKVKHLNIFRGAWHLTLEDNSHITLSGNLKAEQEK